MDTIFEGNTVNMRITEIGTYTFVFNKNDQEHGFTLFVKELVDEEAEIIELERQYGIDHVVVVENQGRSISNVTFENMEVYKAHGRAIGCLIYNSNVENFNISDVVYKNITYNSAKPNKVASNGKTTNKISATFENVYGNGSKLTGLDSKNFEYDQYATITVK